MDAVQAAGRARSGGLATALILSAKPVECSIFFLLSQGRQVLPVSLQRDPGDLYLHKDFLLRKILTACYFDMEVPLYFSET